MTQTFEPGTTMPASKAPRIGALVVAVTLALISAVLLIAGGLLLWGDGQKDRDGYLTTDSGRVMSDGYAVTTDDLDVDLGGADLGVGRDGFGTVRVKAASRSGTPLFIGIGPTKDVDAYLRRSAHSRVTDLDVSPFRPEYRPRDGARRPAPPAAQDFWSASSQGAASSMRWKVQDGSWSAVVMNADGSRGVDAGVSAGARLPFLAPFGWVSLGGGLVLLLAAAAFGIVSVRAPRGRPPGTAPSPAVASPA